MIHRHLSYEPSAPVESLGPAALDDILERGDLADWAPLAGAVSREPFGEVAAIVERLCDAHPLYGTSSLWRAFLDRARARAEGRSRRAVDLSTLRRSRGLSQAELARHLGMSQSDLSKLERRNDVRLSTLLAFVAALGARLTLLVESSGTLPVELKVGPPPGPGNSN